MTLDCDSCPVWTARAALSPANLQALEAYDLLARRIVLDFALAPLVFEALRLRLSTEGARLLVESLDLIHEIRCPLKRPGAHG